MKKHLEIYKEQMWEVHDPWTGQTLAYFFRKEDARMFRKEFDKRRNRDQT